MKNQIKELSQFIAPAGFERKLGEHLLSLLQDIADDTYIDTLGNAIARKHGDGPRTLLTAHMDEPGVMVMHVDDDGFLRFVIIGALTPTQLVGRQVTFTNGVIGVVQVEDAKEAPTLEKLYIDIGETSAEAALKHVQIGLAGVVLEEVREISANMLTGRAVDNRAGCAIVLEVFKAAAEQGKDITVAFTAQETVGSRGANTVAYQVQPDWALVIDGAPSGDVPGEPRMELKLGAGPAVKIMDKSAIVPVAVKDHLINTAKSANCSYQLEVWPTGTSDVGSIHLAVAGIPTGGLSYPVRYVDSTSPVIHLGDVQQSVDLLVRAILEKD